MCEVIIWSKNRVRRPLGGYHGHQVTCGGLDKSGSDRQEWREWDSF